MKEKDHARYICDDGYSDLYLPISKEIEQNLKRLVLKSSLINIIFHVSSQIV